MSGNIRGCEVGTALILSISLTNAFLILSFLFNIAFHVVDYTFNGLVYLLIGVGCLSLLIVLIAYIMLSD